MKHMCGSTPAILPKDQTSIQKTLARQNMQDILMRPQSPQPGIDGLQYQRCVFPAPMGRGQNEMMRTMVNGNYIMHLEHIKYFGSLTSDITKTRFHSVYFSSGHWCRLISLMQILSLCCRKPEQLCPNQEWYPNSAALSPSTWDNPSYMSVVLHCRDNIL